MNRQFPAGLRVSVLALGMALIGAGCDGVGYEPDQVVLEARPSDGLLSSPALQEMLELQIRRDGPALAARLEAPDTEVRARAALALGSVQAPATVPALLDALGDGSASVRRDAAFALGQVGAVEAVPALGSAFTGESDAAVRLQILDALGKLAATEAVEALLSLDVRPPEEPRRLLALSRLGAVGGIATPAGLDRIVESLGDTDPGVRTGAAYYFGRSRVTDPWSDRADRVRSALDRARRDDPSAMYLVQGLGWLGDPADAGRVRRWAREAADWRTRTNAMAALAGSWRDLPETVDALESGLDDPSPHVVVTAAEGLAGVPVPLPVARRIQAWIEATPRPLQVVRPLLILQARMDQRAFVHRWAEGVPADDEDGQGAVLAAMAELAGEDALDRLFRAAASSSQRVASTALTALAGRWSRDRSDPDLGERYVRLFSGVLRDGSPRDAPRAAFLLADSAALPLGGVDTLASAYGAMALPDDERRMTAVLRALGATGAPQGDEILQAAARHAHPGLRRAARASLAARSGEEAAAEGDGGAEDAVATGTVEPEVPLDWAYLRSLGREPRLVLETDHGRIVVRLATEDAPHTVQTIARLAEEGRYDGVPFHRVVPNFVIQGGDVQSGTGFGGPGFTITSEFTLLRFVRGTIGMASAGKDTEGSQFFIAHSMQPHLDGGYTAFGWVVEGMDVVDQVLVGDRILRASIERGG